MMLSKMKNKFEKHFEDTNKTNMLYDFAVILDPRFKLEIIHFGCKQTVDVIKQSKKEMTEEEYQKAVDELVDDVKSKMQMLVSEYETLYQIGASILVRKESDYVSSRHGKNSWMTKFEQYRGVGVQSFEEGTQQIPAEGPSTHSPPVLDAPEPKRQRTDAEEIAKLREDLDVAEDRIIQRSQELWDAIERQEELAHLVHDMRDEMINMIGRLEDSENRAEILEGRIEALEDLVASENEEEDEEEEGEEPAPVVESDPESTVEDD
ncbi:hypothetical protein E3N88_28579 [Mikania micrantha]|uniref:hAT-like transposase RNase-H fold domain-containing protein n=1 Tax=Mikania micrantha TaxID=192012 RepID=A0A5N6N064_9ASTR|nr:hypothetical protein E3N88_28579 [Mikania micrantha]